MIRKCASIGQSYQPWYDFTKDNKFVTHKSLNPDTLPISNLKTTNQSSPDFQNNGFLILNEPLQSQDQNQQSSKNESFCVSTAIDLSSADLKHIRVCQGGQKLIFQHKKPKIYLNKAHLPSQESVDSKEPLNQNNLQPQQQLFNPEMQQQHHDQADQDMEEPTEDLIAYFKNQNDQQQNPQKNQIPHAKSIDFKHIVPENKLYRKLVQDDGLSFSFNPTLNQETVEFDKPLKAQICYLELTIRLFKYLRLSKIAMISLQQAFPVHSSSSNSQNQPIQLTPCLSLKLQESNFYRCVYMLNDKIKVLITTSYSQHAADSNTVKNKNLQFEPLRVLIEPACNNLHKIIETQLNQILVFEANKIHAEEVGTYQQNVDRCAEKFRAILWETFYQLPYLVTLPQTSAVQQVFGKANSDHGVSIFHKITTLQVQSGQESSLILNAPSKDIQTIVTYINVNLHQNQCFTQLQLQFNSNMNTCTLYDMAWKQDGLIQRSNQAHQQNQQHLQPSANHHILYNQHGQQPRTSPQLNPRTQMPQNGSTFSLSELKYEPVLAGSYLQILLTKINQRYNNNHSSNNADVGLRPTNGRANYVHNQNPMQVDLAYELQQVLNQAYQRQMQQKQLRMHNMNENDFGFSQQDEVNPKGILFKIDFDKKTNLNNSDWMSKTNEWMCMVKQVISYVQMFQMCEYAQPRFRATMVHKLMVNVPYDLNLQEELKITLADRTASNRNDRVQFHFSFLPVMNLKLMTYPFKNYQNTIMLCQLELHAKHFIENSEQDRDGVNQMGQQFAKICQLFQDFFVKCVQPRPPHATKMFFEILQNTQLWQTIRLHEFIFLQLQFFDQSQKWNQKGQFNAMNYNFVQMHSNQQDLESLKNKMKLKFYMPLELATMMPSYQTADGTIMPAHFQFCVAYVDPNSGLQKVVRFNEEPPVSAQAQVQNNQNYQQNGYYQQTPRSTSDTGARGMNFRPYFTRQQDVATKTSSDPASGSSYMSPPLRQMLLDPHFDSSNCLTRILALAGLELEQLRHCTSCEQMLYHH